jgi:hypothetical protein
VFSVFGGVTSRNLGKQHIVGHDNCPGAKARMEKVKAGDVQIFPEVEENEVDLSVQFCQGLLCIPKPEVDEVREAGLMDSFARERVACSREAPA